MVLGFRRSLTVFTIVVLFFRRCYALDLGLISWRFENRSVDANELIECESLNISLSPASLSGLGKAPYYLLSFEPGGIAATTPVSSGLDSSSSLQWQVRHRAGSQLVLALVDSVGTSLGVLPVLYTVTAGFKQCQPVQTALTPRATPTHPKISSPLIGSLVPCGTWNLSVSGGRAPYTVSLASLGSRNVYNFSVSLGQNGLEYINRGEISGQVVAAVSDADGIFGTTTSIIDIVSAGESPADAAFSACQSGKTESKPSNANSPRTRTPRLPRRVHTPHIRIHLDMDDVLLIDSSREDTIIVAVCASIGGAGLIASAAYVIMMYRRRKRGLIGGQDTLPRPFEIVVPAPGSGMGSRMGMSTASLPRLNVDVPIPVFDISPRNNTESGTSGSGGGTGGGGKADRLPSTRKPSRIHTVPNPVPPRQGTTSGGSRTPRQRPSDSSMHSSHDANAGPSSYRSPDRSRTRTRAHTQPGPQPQSQSRSHSGSRRTHDHPSHSTPSIPTQPQPLASGSTSVQEQRSAKRALYISRSASDMYRAASSVPRYRSNDYDTYPASSRHHHHRPRAYTHELDANARQTNYLRPFHSASPIVRLSTDSEPDEEGAIIIQHRDAGIMHELPPPYHKLVRNDGGV